MLGRLEASGPQPGFFNKDWPLFIRYLVGHAALSGDEGPLLDKLWRLKPPPGQAAWEWDTFMSYVQTEAAVLEAEWSSSTTATDEGTKWCRDGLAVEEGSTTLKTTTPQPPCPIKRQGECMFVPQTMKSLAVNIDSTINSDGAAVNDTAVNERKRGQHKVPPDKGLSREGPCGEGGNPPYNNEYNIGRPIGLPCITRMYTECWNPSKRMWQTWHSDHNCHMEQSQKGRASTLITELPEKEDDEKHHLEALRKKRASAFIDEQRGDDNSHHT